MSVFDFKIEYREGKKNPADRLSRRPDLRVSGEALEARKAPLASFLGRFTSAPWKEAQVAVAVRLLRTLSYPETVGLARACRPPAASHSDYLFRRTSESASKGHSPAGPLQHGRLGPYHRVVQDDQGS